MSVSGIPEEVAQNIPGLNAEDIADGILYIISTKPHVNIPELTLKHANASS